MQDRFTLEELQAVEVVVCHRNGPATPCPDGTAAAILIHDAIPNAEVVFASHAELAAIEPRAGMLYCDITPTDEQGEAHRALRTIILDHHETRREFVGTFERGVFAEHGRQSGASLAFLHVWSPVHAARVGSKMSGNDKAEVAKRALHFATLAAVRDTWDKDHPWWWEACCQAEALAFWDWKELLSPAPFDGRWLEERMAVGAPLRRKRLREAAALAETAMWGTTEKGTSIAIVNALDTSDVAELVTADVLAGFQYRQDRRTAHPRLRFSLRARGDYDVGAVSKAMGGGGHRAAAGFDVEAEETFAVHGSSFFYDDPWRRIVRIIDRHERGEHLSAEPVPSYCPHGIGDRACSTREQCATRWRAGDRAGL